jgi:hypothetical protein
MMKESLNHEAQQKERAQQKVEEMETQIHILFQAIPDNTNEEAVSSEEKLRRIEKTIQHYKEKIKELEEHVTPTTPPEVRVQREQEATTTAEDIDRSIQRVTDLLEKSAQLWTHLLEDGSLQELQERENKLHAAMAEVKQ